MASSDRPCYLSLKKIVHRRRRRSPPPQETIAYKTTGVEAFTNGLISWLISPTSSGSVCMWALWVREWGHMATSRPLRASNQIFKLLQMFFKKRKNEKKRGPFCNCAVPFFVVAIFIKTKLLCSHDDSNVQFIFQQIQA